MKLLRYVRGPIRRDPRILCPFQPGLLRGYSVSASQLSTHEHIIVSSPKPGVGLSKSISKSQSSLVEKSADCV